MNKWEWLSLRWFCLPFSCSSRSATTVQFGRGEIEQMSAIKAVGLVLVILCAPLLDQAWRDFEYVPCPADGPPAIPDGCIVFNAD
jgi:hypothetical protein